MRLHYFLHYPVHTPFGKVCRSYSKRIADRLFTLNAPFTLSCTDQEIKTLDSLWKYCRNTKSSGITEFVGYLHPKGCSKPSCFQDDWRELMLYFLIDGNQNIISHLDRFPQVHAVGCNKKLEPSPHFSGNMWIARKDFIATLPRPLHITDSWGPSWGGRCRAEMFIGLRGEEFLHSIHDSWVNHYVCRYNSSLYKKN
jgi:hypothetical protein